MAIIPKKNKSNSMADTGAVEILMVLVFAYVVIDAVFSRYIHNSLGIILMLVIGLVGLYLFLPNDKCKGRNGYMRILNCIRYELFRLQFLTAKHTYEQEQKR